MYISVHELERVVGIQVAPAIIGAFFPSVFAKYPQKKQGPISSRVQKLPWYNILIRKAFIFKIREFIFFLSTMILEFE